MTPEQDSELANLHAMRARHEEDTWARLFIFSLCCFFGFLLLFIIYAVSTVDLPNCATERTTVAATTTQQEQCP